MNQRTNEPMNQSINKPINETIPISVSNNKALRALYGGLGWVVSGSEERLEALVIYLVDAKDRGLGSCTYDNDIVFSLMVIAGYWWFMMVVDVFIDGSWLVMATALRFRMVALISGLLVSFLIFRAEDSAERRRPMLSHWMLWRSQPLMWRDWGGEAIFSEIEDHLEAHQGAIHTEAVRQLVQI